MGSGMLNIIYMNFTLYRALHLGFPDCPFVLPQKEKADPCSSVKANVPESWPVKHQ